MTARPPALTLCSVSFHSAGFLRLNREAVAALNPGVAVRWVVAENSPANASGALAAGEPGIDVIDGAGPGHVPIHHHTIALAKAVAASSTRFVAVIDPDLYVVRRGWIEAAIAHMQARGLAILGVPWHPQSGAKYRYFPAVHWSLFDTERFPRAAIDFRPDYPDGASDPAWPHGWNEEAAWFSHSPLVRALARLPGLAPRRRWYTDTGSRLYKRHGGPGGPRFELIEPAWSRAALAARLSASGRVLEALLPDELCRVPKHYAEHPGFIAPALGEGAPKWWEQFVWQGAPFAFHVRRNLDRAARAVGDELALARTLLKALGTPVT
jgi:hypothetical protein